MIKDFFISLAYGFKSIFDGIAGIFVIQPIVPTYEHESISSDWYRVGDYLRISIEKFEKEDEDILADD